MGHFAEIDLNNIVLRVIVANTKEWCEEYLGGNWVQTSYNTYGGVHLQGGIPLRKNFAGIGYTYDEQRDAFIAPKPFNSWTLDEDTCQWKAPVAYPTDGKFYVWNENQRNWEEVIVYGN